MQIILSILQFIGIALLVLLGIVLVLILLILFYPICYTLEGELYSEKNAKAKVSWLFHLIRAKVVYEDDVIFAKIGVLWKNIPFLYEFSSKTESEDEDEIQADMDNWMETADWENVKEVEEEILWEESSKENIEENIDKGFCVDEIHENEVIREEHSMSAISEEEVNKSEANTINLTKDKEISSDNIAEKKIDVSEIKKEEKLKEITFQEKSGEEKLKEATSQEKSEQTTSQKSSQKQNSDKCDNTEQHTDDFCETEEEKIGFIEKIKGMISKIKGTINKITQIWNEIKAIITDESNQLAVKHIKDEGIYLVKIFLPKKTKIDGIFSAGSPHRTGQAFGVICTFPILYQNGWSLQPDFMADKAYFQGSFYAKGRIYLYKMVVSALRILLDKNCRRLYKKIKQFMNKLK